MVLPKKKKDAKVIEKNVFVVLGQSRAGEARLSNFYHPLLAMKGVFSKILDRF